MLGTLEEYQKSDWKAHVPTLVHAYSTTIHDSTGYSPYFLMFGRHPRLAIDAFLGLSPDTLSAKHQTEYAKKLREHLQFAYRTAQKSAQKSAAKQKATYDLKVRHCTLHEGDRVLVKNVGLRGKRKLADWWERTPYVIKSQPNPNIPVYEVKSGNSRARKTRVLHRNLLLPFSCLGLPRGRRRSVPNEHDSVPDDTLIQISDPSANESDTDERVVKSQMPNTSDTPVSRYNDSVKGKDRETVLLPRSTSTSSIESIDTDSQRPERPKRARKPPGMKSPDWVLSQAPTYEFWVDPKDIVRL